MGKIVWSITVLFFGWQIYNIGTLFFPTQCGSDTAHCISPEHPPGSLFELRMYRCNKIPRRVSLDQLDESDNFFTRRDVSLDGGAWEQSDVVVPLYSNTRNNGSIAVIVALVPQSGNVNAVVFTAAYLTSYESPVRLQSKYLLDSEGNTGSKQRSVVVGGPPVTHWKPWITLRAINDHRSYDKRTKPGDIPLRLHGNGKGNTYIPYVYADELHMLKKLMVPLSSNSSRADPSIKVRWRPVNVGVFRIFRQLEQSMTSMHALGLTEKDTDEILELMNPDRAYKLLVTYIIAFLHTVFSFLAFRNDIGFWKGRENIQGLSRRAIIGNAFCSLIIFLFLADNNTSYLILGTMGVSVLIDFWKVTKVVDICRANKRTEAERVTEAHDATGMKYISYILIPCVVGWAMYTLVYHPHRGYYSWFISAAANAVYAFGFILMLPQVFINHKLKSTAYLPWRAMTYKLFNTFVDDVMAFWLLEMPTIHRLATLRDDIVFFIYLYQRWLYPVDKKRANEFGMAYETDEGEVAGQNNNKSKTE